MLSRYFVYILRCADNSLYTGTSPDPAERLQIHNSGKGAKYTRSRLPVKLVYSEKCEDKGSALSREAEIKGMNRREKLELISQAQKSSPQRHKEH